MTKIRNALVAIVAGVVVFSIGVITFPSIASAAAPTTTASTTSGTNTDLGTINVSSMRQQININHYFSDADGDTLTFALVGTIPSTTICDIFSSLTGARISVAQDASTATSGHYILPKSVGVCAFSLRAYDPGAGVVGPTFFQYTIAATVPATTNPTIGQGSVTDVVGDNPAESWNIIVDRSIEWTPIVLTIVGGLFAFSLVFGLIYMGLRRSRRAMFGGK